ncbi:MAG: hypothetical protein ACPGFC_09510 [Paracoccaceae bacterium]
MTDPKGVDPQMPDLGAPNAVTDEAQAHGIQVHDTQARDPLEDFFAAAQAHPAQPSATFLARMQAEALAEQPVAGLRVAPAPDPQTEVGWVRGLIAGVSRALAEVGGWAGVSGLAAATVVGIWFGAAPPEAVSDSVAALLYGADSLTLDPMTGFDFAAMEG